MQLFLIKTDFNLVPNFDGITLVCSPPSHFFLLCNVLRLVVYCKHFLVRQVRANLLIRLECNNRRRSLTRKTELTSAQVAKLIP